MTFNVTQPIEPHDLPVTINIGEDALKAIAEANAYNNWHIDCMGRTIGRIIQEALAEKLAEQLPDATYRSQGPIEAAIDVTITDDDGRELVERANEVNGPTERDFDVELDFERYVITVTAESADNARDIAYEEWRERVSTFGLELRELGHVAEVGA